MASDFFRILRGLVIDEKSAIMTGTGTPSGADQNSAAVGSVFLENDTASNLLNVWYKFQSTTSTVADWSQLASKAYVDSTSTGSITWKNPVVTQDITSTTLPTGTAGNPITVNGVSVVNGDRVLLSSLTTNPNVYVYNQSTGLFTLATDVTNPAATGTATYVSGGTTAGETYVFNGTQWVLISQADATDISFLRSFVGALATGTAAPNYTSTNLVVQGSNLVTAVSALDAGIGAAPAAISGSTIISPTNTVNQNIESIAQTVANNTLEGKAVGVTTSVQVDTVTAVAAKYLFHVEQVGSTTNVRAYEVFVAHNGVTTDLTRFATLAFGTAPVGFDVTATLTGGNTMNISVVSTTSVNVRWKRVGIVDVA